MNSKFCSFAGLCLLAAACLSSVAALAQQPRPFHNGPIWDIAFIRVHYGQQDRYLGYLAGEWKQTQETMKKAGYILDYKVITTDPHNAEDYDVILMTEFKDLASLEANEDKMRELEEKQLGGPQKAQAGAESRGNFREVLGDRIGREIILEPKSSSMAQK
jgi:hypothetical protein